ncbi:unnamed protein product [Echinostoma caproni]|uniref:Protein muscleblind n=1 Tax=Echinostoma caproni TaxID=27848 RepID=A0A183A6V3_9TREM|nr:unnamed protein product [Echinostoma caproni]
MERITLVLSRPQSNGLFLHGYPPPAPFGRRLTRDPVSLYDSDVSTLDQKPQLQASHEKNFTVLKCSVSRPKSNAEIYLLCPALADRYGTGHCYQGCTPTEPCSRSARSEQKSCVPNDQTVFCEQVKYANGTTTIQVKIDRTDPRLSGFWSCTHAGMESAKFKISLEHPDISDAKPVEQPTNQKVSDVNVAYMRKPVVLFTVLAILILSLLINMGFCIRCLIMRSYIDAQNEGSSNASCLAACLCLPKEMRKVSSVRMTPVLPRLTYNPNNMNGSYQGSAGLLYPSTTSTMQKMPLLFQPASQPELAGMAYYPAVSLTGTLGRPGGQRMYSGSLIQSPTMQQQQQQQQSHSDGYPTPHLAYTVNMDGTGLLTQSTGAQPGQGSMPGVNDYGKPNSYIPSYIRVPSVNAPSPSLSHKLLYSTNNAVIQPPQGFAPDQNLTLVTDGQSGAQYFLKLPPNALGPHVVYDDVAAGNSSVVGSQTQSQNQSLLLDQAPTTMVQIPAFYQSPTNRAPSAESSPNINNSRTRGPQSNLRMGTGAVGCSTPTSGVNGPGGFSLPPLGNPMSSRIMINQPDYMYSFSVD